MSEHTPEYRNFRGPFFIRDCPGRREIRCESGRYIAESAKSGAPGIDAELAKVIRQMAAAPLLVEACKAALLELDTWRACESTEVRNQLSAALAAVGE